MARSATLSVPACFSFFSGVVGRAKVTSTEASEMDLDRTVYCVVGSTRNVETCFAAEWEGAWGHFFGQCPRLYCPDQFTATMPFYASLLYSGAAIVSGRASEGNKQSVAE